MKSDFQYKEYEIITKKELSPDTFLFEMSGKINFVPGQFIRILLDHFGEATFAPCSNPENQKSFQFAVRACGNITNQLVKMLPGNKLKIRGPYGNGWPMAKLIGKNVLIIGGGIGIFPIRPLVYELLKYKNEFKKIDLIFGLKTDGNILFEEDLRVWSKKIKLGIFCESVGHCDLAHKGLITKPLETLKIDKNTIVLMCGPEPMYKYCNEILLSKKIPKENIFISFERRMECGIGFCQHCNIGKYLVCKDGPVFSLSKIENEIGK